MTAATRATLWIWLAPVTFVVHDSEELATMIPWLARHRAALPAIIRPLAGITTTQLAVGVIVLFLGIAIAAWHGASRAREGRLSMPFLVVAGALVGNGVGHVLQAVYMRDYVPGLVTAVLLSIPYGIGLARALDAAGLAPMRRTLLACALGLVVQVPLALGALAIG